MNENLKIIIEEIKEHLKNDYQLDNVSFSDGQIKTITWMVKSKNSKEISTFFSKDLLKEKTKEIKFNEFKKHLENDFNIIIEFDYKHHSSYEINSKLSYIKPYEFAKNYSDDLIMKNKIKLFKEHLKNDFGWKNDINYYHLNWIEEDLKTLSPKEAAGKHDKRCDRIAQSVAAEWQSKHSAMSHQGAKSYADNWN